VQLNRAPVFKDVVLVGGGHAHALLVLKWAMQPIPGVRLTLISPDPHTPYSGMLPGLIAGHYGFDEIHIDLVRLCRAANVRFLCASMTGLDPENKRLSLAGRPALDFDVLSINTGSTPNQNIPGVAEFAVPIKPISGFWQHWLTLREQISKEKKLSIAVVGGGAGSVEAVLAMAWACRNSGEDKASFQLVTRADNILPGYPKNVRRAAENACRQLGIELLTRRCVTTVHQNSLLFAEGESLSCDKVFWCIDAGAPYWTVQSGLGCTDEGFIRVNACLQSESHEMIFAAGDIAHMTATPRPKAGVYAVRQAPYLYDNICALLLEKPLTPFRPQDKFLSLLSLGGKSATGSRGWLSGTGEWLWRLKDHIDRKFMGRFEALYTSTAMGSEGNIPEHIVPMAEREEILDQGMRCGGCGSKVGAIILENVLAEGVRAWQPEDASILAWPEKELIQSVDQIKAPFDDPWLFGRIAVLHALNDIWAMNAIPHSILVAVTLPFAGRTTQEREFSQVMSGIKLACEENGVSLLGGHTSEGQELSIAVTANGLPGTYLFNKTGGNKGDLLMLSKPLGTGIVLAGHMQGYTAGRNMKRVLAQMAQSNQHAWRALAKADVSACTDVSGFGLLGHLAEMLAESGLSIELDMSRLPLLDGVEALIAEGVRSSLHSQNEENYIKFNSLLGINHLEQHALWPVLLDPQTSGGLLAAVKKGSELPLEEAGFHQIGCIVQAETQSAAENSKF